MPAKIARSPPRPSFGLPDALVAVLTSRLSCRKARKTRVFTPVRESSGEFRFTASSTFTRSRPATRALKWAAGSAKRLRTLLTLAD